MVGARYNVTHLYVDFKCTHRAERQESYNHPIEAGNQSLSSACLVKNVDLRLQTFGPPGQYKQSQKSLMAAFRFTQIVRFFKKKQVRQIRWSSDNKISRRLRIHQTQR